MLDEFILCFGAFVPLVGNFSVGVDLEVVFFVAMISMKSMNKTSGDYEYHFEIFFRNESK